MGTRKIISDPEVNFETFWETFNNRYPFFELRKVNWENQYEIFRPRVTSTTSDVELFDIMCDMIRPLNDGHIELFAKNVGGKKRYFNPELKPKFWQEFEPKKIKKLLKTTAATLTAHGFGKPKKQLLG